jgi:hypothetical protein
VSLYGDYLVGCDCVQSVIVWRMHEHGEVGATLVRPLSSEVLFINITFVEAVFI